MCKDGRFSFLAPLTSLEDQVATLAVHFQLYKMITQTLQNGIFERKYGEQRLLYSQE